MVGPSPEQAITIPLKREIVTKPNTSDFIIVYWLQHSFWDQLENPGGLISLVEMIVPFI